MEESTPKFDIIWEPQEGPQLQAVACPCDEICFGGSRGGGKMLSDSAYLLTPKGWTTHGEVRAGDTITDPRTGGTQKVISVHPQGKIPLYRVTFDDGASVLAGLEHLWLYKTANHVRPGTKPSKQRDFIKQVFPQMDYHNEHLDLLKVGTTAEMQERLQRGNGNPRIPLTAPVLFDVNGRTGTGSVDPYLIGVMLGDGTFPRRKAAASVTNEDEYVIDFILDQGFYRSGKKKSSSGIYLHYRLAADCSRGLLTWCMSHKLYGATGKGKFIPEYVFTAPVEYRLSVLQGLLDTDGSVDERGHVEFSNISDDLVYGVQKLVWSFGGKATVSEPFIGTYMDADGNRVECQEYRRVYISSEHASGFFRIPRKKARCVDSWNGGFKNMRKLVSIEYEKDDYATCIKVSSPHGLYVTDDYIVTHNTDTAIGRQIDGALKHGYQWNGLFLRKNFKHFAELRRRIDELIRMGLPAIRTGGDTQTNFVKFDNGGMITLTAIERSELLDFFQGQQFCQRIHTLIDTPTGPVPIEDLRVGDLVSTLNGPRKVTRTFPHREALCVEAATPFGADVFPATHVIMVPGSDKSSACEWQSYASLLGNDSIETELTLQEFLELPSVVTDAVLSQHAFCQVASSEVTPILSRFVPKFCSLLTKSMEIFLKPLFSLRSGLLQACEQVRSSRVGSLDCACASPACAPIYGHHEKLAQDSQSNYSACSRQCGEHLQALKGLFLKAFPFLNGADKKSPGFARLLGGVLDNILSHIHAQKPRYEHPYDGTVRLATEESLFGACYLSPFGMETVVDITVDDVNHYISHSSRLVNKNCEISIEEATQFNFLIEMIDRLKGCLRSPHGINCQMFLTANPGGPGHHAVKARYIDPAPPRTVIRDEESGETRVFIPSNVEDNKILCDKDPKYVNRLKGITDPNLRKAWYEGDWDVVMGGFFDDVWSRQKHVLPMFKPPRHWTRIMGFDWGSARPFSVGWYAISDGIYNPIIKKILPRGSIVRYAEWYGCEKGSPNVGLRMNSVDVAKGIIIRETKRNEHLITFDRVADPAVFITQDGPPISEKMSEHGVFLRPGDNKRIAGWDECRVRLAGNKDDGPMFYVTENCVDFIRTVPSLERDDRDWEDVDCWVAGTLVSTPDGQVPIENVRMGQPVNTPIGVKKAIKSGCSGVSDTFFVNLENGVQLRGTKDHKVMIKDRGLLPLCMISSGDIVITEEEFPWLLRMAESGSRKETTEDMLSAIQRMHMYLGQHCYTEPYGRMRWEQSRKITRYITSTEMQPTTMLKILNSYIRAITLDTITKKEGLPVGASVGLVESGEKPKKGNAFFEKILRNAVTALPKENLRALIVANLLQRDSHGKSFVDRNVPKWGVVKKLFARFVEKLFCKKPTIPKKSGLVVTSVGGCSEKEKVYNLVVEQAHLYYANGVLSSNTDNEDHIGDEWRYILMSRQGKGKTRLDGLPKGPRSEAQQDWDNILGNGNDSAINMEAW